MSERDPLSPSRTRRPAAAPGPPESRKEGELQTPYLKEVREFFRHLTVCEKNLGLYPAYSKVVKRSLDSFFEAARETLSEIGPLRVTMTQNDVRYEDEQIYDEEEKSKSLAFRIYKDGVREICFRPEVSRSELTEFVTCLKEARKVDEDEDDFITLFWEKDSPNIQIQLADDFLTSEDLPDVPESHSFFDSVRPERFKIPAEEKERLREVLEQRKEEHDGDSTFVIDEEEARALREMVKREEEYIPLFDFIDILLEVMVRNPNPEEFSRSVKMIRTIIAALVEDLDFNRAAFLMEKLSREAHPGLTDAHRTQLREMLETFTDKETMTVLNTFLEENDRLARDHSVFRFLKSYPESSAESFCALLRHQKHVASISEVLVCLGSGHAEAYARYLEDPDPLVVRAMIGVLLRSDQEKPLEKIARALRHPDENVRVYGAKTILENGDASVGGLFVPLLTEPSRQLLNLALQYFAKFPCADAYRKLERLTKSRAFGNLDGKRQALCFKALLRASFGKGMEYVCGSVLRWVPSLTGGSRQRKAAAIAALGVTESTHSRATLERFAASKRSPLCAPARRALRQLDALRQRRGDSEAPAGKRRIAKKTEVTRV